MNKAVTAIGQQILLLAIFFGSFQISFAQSNKLDKKLQKAKDLAENNKLKEADKILVDLLKENPDYGDGWDFLSRVRYADYMNSKTGDGLFQGNITVTTKGSDGKDVPAENDSLAKQFVELLNGLQPSKIAYNKYLYTMRKALLSSEDAYQCSAKLRTLLIDPPVDTTVTKKALRYFNDAEAEFEKNNYEAAAQLYKRAIAEQPDFYKARLYLGDAYYFTGNYVMAISSFKEAIAAFPGLVEPRKYLVDAYAKERLYDEALNEAIKGMSVYPDLSLKRKLDDAAYLNEKKINIKWTARPVFPNTIKKAGGPKEMNTYEDPDKPEAAKPWDIYQKAPDKVKDLCNTKGIFEKTTPLTKSSYLEVFSWEEMLSASNDPILDEARRMQKDGYLDCYVLVSCYHIDFYDQYSDFIAKHKDKVDAYFSKYITKSQ